ncbi:repeating unit O-acetyltransferase WefK [Streptococcus pneumoniae]|nr:repeating unit O-acetyltransferase WefK [Streptococcus pneumoniae]
MHKFKDINLDLLKVIACVGVVLLHTEMGGFKETGSWNFSTYLYYLGTYSIPLFFIVNGYLLLGKKEITYSYILQKVKYILITVLSWTFIVWLFKRDFSVNPIKNL